MKLLTKNLIIFLAVVGVGALPSCANSAKINGTVSKNHFYDLEKTIMTEVSPDVSVKNEAFWGKNILYINKYRPLFLLSNKDLYNLMPERRISVVQTMTTPSVYNISLKTASVKKVFLTPPPKKQEVKENTFTLYEEAKNKESDCDKKIDTAILIKETKKPSDYNLALDLLDDVTRKEPYNAYAYFVKGEVYREKKDTENAMKNYAESLKLNPLSKQSCLGIAKILEPTNKELAQKYYERAK